MVNPSTLCQNVISCEIMFTTFTDNLCQSCKHLLNTVVQCWIQNYYSQSVNIILKCQQFIIGERGTAQIGENKDEDIHCLD